MMVQSRPVIKTTHPDEYTNELDQASNIIVEISKSSKSVSSDEIKKSITFLKDCNKHLDANFLQGKTLVPAQMKSSIENALRAVALFNSNRPENNAAAQKSVTQAIVGLFSALREEVKKLDKNLRDIKKYRIGQHVEEINKSKDTK